MLSYCKCIHVFRCCLSSFQLLNFLKRSPTINGKCNIYNVSCYKLRYNQWTLLWRKLCKLISVLYDEVYYEAIFASLCVEWCVVYTFLDRLHDITVVINSPETAWACKLRTVYCNTILMAIGSRQTSAAAGIGVQWKQASL